MIIDVHCHVWPDEIAPRVLASNPAGLTPFADGTVAGLLRTMDAAGVERACCLGVANVAKNVERTNEFIGSVDRSRLYAFGTVHQDLSVEENLRSLRNNGIQGIKLHPNFQGISLSDPRVIEILRGVAELGLVAITHAGEGSNEDASRRGSPLEILKLTREIPSLKLIACHYGGYHRLDEATSVLEGTTVVLETSWPPSIAELDGERIKGIINRHGADRFVFGSDWPMAEPAREIETLRDLGLSSGDLDAVLGGTLEKLLNNDLIEGGF